MVRLRTKKVSRTALNCQLRHRLFLQREHTCDAPAGEHVIERCAAMPRANEYPAVHEIKWPGSLKAIPASGHDGENDIAARD